MRFKSSLILFVSVFAVLAASCGVSRDASSDVVATDPTVTSDADGSGDGNADGSGDGSTDAPPSTVQVPAAEYTAPDYGDLQTAATLTFPDGSTAEIPVSDITAITDQIDQNQEAANILFNQSLPPSFDLDVLSSLVQVQVLDKGLEVEGGSLEAGALETEKANLSVQLDSVAAGSDDPVATKGVIEAGLSEYLDLVAEQRIRQAAYADLFVADDEEAEVPCTRHILVEDEVEALIIVDMLADGSNFEQLAIERSTGPSGPQGGDLGCSDPAGFVPEFRDAVIGATEGEVVGPVETQFGFHVLTVYGSEVAPVDPDIARQRSFESFSELQSSTEIEVDPVIGRWDAEQSRVVVS